MTAAHPPALLLGTDTPIGLAVIRDLGRHGVPVHGIGSSRALGRASRHLAGFSMRGEGPLASWLPERVRDSGAKALFAISETDLLQLAPVRHAFPGCAVLTPPPGPLARVLDKSATLAAARALGIDVPESVQPVGADANLPGLHFPAVLKWADATLAAPVLAAHGIELLKAEYCRDAAELAAALARYAPTGIFPLVQSYCPGVGLGQMLHMADGRATLRFQHERLREWPPEGGVSTACRAVPLSNHAAQMAKSEALLATLDWEGPAMVEYRYDAHERRYRLMEINGRFWGSQPLAYAAGADFAWEAYRRAVLGETAAAPAARANVSARFLIPDTRRLARVLFARRRIADPAFVARPLRDIVGWLAAFVDPRVRGYLWDWRDPGPALADLRNMLLKVLGR